MQKSRNILCLFTALVFSTSLLAQVPGQPTDSSSLGTEEVYVEKAYAPIIADAVKVSFPAQLPPYEDKKPQLNYSVPSSRLNMQYEPVDIRPLAIAKEKSEPFPASYLKVGIGTQFSPLVELRYNEGEYEKFHYGALLRHHSGRGSRIKHQDFADNSVSVFTTNFFKGARWRNQLDYSSNANFFYGYDHSVDDFKRKDVKQRFNNYEFTTELNSFGENDLKLDYKPRFNAYYYNDIHGLSESDLNFSLRLRRVFEEKHYVTLDILEDYTVFEGLRRNIFSFKPVYEFNDQTWKAVGGVNATFEGSTFHFFPELCLQRSLFREYMVYYSGWRIELRKNSYKSLSMENPYLDSDVELRNSRFEDKYMGMKGTIQKFNYEVQLAQNIVRHLPLYVNDTADMKRFDVIYDRRVSITHFHGEFGISPMSDLDFVLATDYRLYEMAEEDRPWHLPALKVNFKTKYNIGEKIYSTLDVFWLDGVYARLPDGSGKKMNSSADVNLGIRYKYSNYFTFFCNLNNLAFIRYEKWYNYPTYGFNGMVGVILTY